jgi:hypothetical protein
VLDRWEKPGAFAVSDNPLFKLGAPTSIIATFINKNKKIRRVPGSP